MGVSARSAGRTIQAGGMEGRTRRGGRALTVVSGLIGRLSCSGVPPSLTIFAFLRWSRRSWFFFRRASSSSILRRRQQICTRHHARPTELRRAGAPFHCPPVPVSVTRRCQEVGDRVLLLDGLALLHVRRDNGHVAHDLGNGLAVHNTPDAEHPPCVRARAALACRVADERRPTTEDGRGGGRGRGLVVVLGQLWLVLAAQGVELRFPDSLDLGLVDLLLLGDVVTVGRLRTVLCLSCEAVSGGDKGRGAQTYQASARNLRRLSRKCPSWRHG